MNIKPSIHVILSFLLTGAAAFAQNGEADAAAANFPRLTADPKALEFAQRGNARTGGGYSWTDLVEISLWASSSGDSSETIARNAAAGSEHIRAAAAELIASPELPADAMAKAEYILEFMYKNFLKTYSLR